MANNYEIPDFNQIALDLRNLASRYAASESVKFFKESFVKQGWTDSSFQAWEKSKSPLAGKRTLYQNGTLMQSLKKRSASIDKIIIEADSDYAEIHNDGGTITVTAQMKKFWWAKYCEAAGIKKNDSGSTDWKKMTAFKTNKAGTQSSLSKHNVSLSRKAAFCKRMALMKVGSKIKIPQRQFIGHSQTMIAEFDSFLRNQTDIVFKQHLND